jgi:hypothetical protein
MQRDKELLHQRAAFCKKAMQNPKEAANELRLIADGLENCRTTCDIVSALSEIYAVSERTILYDLVR